MINNSGSYAAGSAFHGCGFPLKKFQCFTAMAAMLVQLAILALPGALNAQFTNGGWLYNRTVTVAPTGLSGSAETNFPVLVRLNGKIANGGNSSDSLVFANSLSTGYDIRFAQTGYTDSVPFEIERYDNANMYAEFWVLIPSVSVTASTTFKMYFGNAGVSGSPSAPSRVWTHANGFGLVYHMNYNAANASDVGPDGVTGTYTSGITMNTGTTATGAIGYGESFGGASGNDYTAVLSANGKPPAFQYLWTVSGWFYLNSSGNLGGGVFDKGADLTSTFHSGSNGFVFCNGTGFGAGTCPAYSNYYGNMRTTATVGTGGWHHVAWEYQGTGSSSTAPATQNIFIDGAAQTLSATAYVNKADGYADVWVGACNNHIASTSDYFNGSMDEFRIDTAYRSANWVALNYQTQMPPSVGAGIVSLSPFILGPGAPVLSSPTNNSINQPIVNLSLNWTSGSGAAVTSYEVQVATNAGFSSTVYDFPGVTATSQALPTLSNYVTYYWRVDATGSGGTGPWSGVWTFTTATLWAPPPLTAPANNAINQALSPNVTWMAVTGASSYEIYVTTDPTFVATPFLDQTGVTTNTLNIPGLANYTTYYWRVNAYDNTLTQSPDPTAWSGVWTFTIVIAAPVLSTPTNNATNQPLSLSLNWGTVTGAASYAVQVSTASGFGTTVFSQSGLSGLLQTLGGLATSKTYYWEVSATGGNGGTGAWSAVWSFTTVPPAPGVPALSTPSNEWAGQPLTPNLTWGSVATAASYEVQVSMSSGFSPTILDQPGITGTSQTVGPLSLTTSYYWRVNATNAGGTGSWSSASSFTTVENYSLWSNHIPIALNTTSGGANVANNVYNFPVLVRLTSSNFSGFGSVQAGGADIRFSKSADYTKPLPFQIQRWDATRDLAEIWVLLDTVLGNSSAQTITMHYGNGGAASQSNGPEVFTSGNGFIGVYHMQDLTDATGANTVGLTDSGSTPTKVPAPIDSGWNLNGTSDFRIAGNSGAPATVTLSAWVNVASGAASAQQIISLANSPSLEEEGTTGTNVMFYNNAAGSWPAWNGTAATELPGNGWQYVTGVFNPAGSFEGYYQNGAVPAGLQSVNSMGSSNSGIVYTQTPQTTCIGYNSTNTGRILNGSLNEVRIENTARSASWIALCYANQNANQTLVSINPLPSVPTLSSPTNNSVGQSTALTLGWNSASGALTYEVQVATAAGFGAAIVSDQAGLSGLSAAPAGLAGGATYFWRVDATNGNGTTAWSSVWSFSTLAPWGAPMPFLPANNAINQPTSPTLSWSAVSGAQSYGIQISNTTTFASTIVGQTGLTGVSQALTGLSNYTTYYWEVNAYDGISLTTSWSTIDSFTTIIAAPVLSGPSNGAINQPVSLSLNWGAVAGANAYALMVSTSSAFGTTAFSQTGISGTSQAVSGLASLTTYYWEAGATGNGATTAWSTAWSFTTVPPTPGVPVLATPANGASNQPPSPTLTWGTVAMAVSYEAQVSLSSGFSSTILDQPGITGTSQAIGPLVSATTYYWRVNAANSAGAGAWSGVYSFTTVENYTAWSHHLSIGLNTTSGGANVVNNVTRFPVLVRLNPSNFSGFGQVNYQPGIGAIDVRFSKTDYTKAFPYQIDYWSPTNDTAVIWVLVDTVFGNSSSQSIVMHYGNGSAANASNGAAVFDTGNGYQAVYHFSETSAGNANDATVNGYTATNIAAPAVVSGVIGNARSFNGTTQGFWVPNTESPPSKVCFPSQGIYTFSAWVLSNWTTGDGSTPAIISKGTTTAGQYHLFERGTAGTTTSYEYSLMEQRASGGAQSKRTPAGGIAASTQGTWVHIVGVRNGPTTPIALYINGVNAGTGSDSVTSGGTRDTTEDVGIGTRLTTGSSPTDTNRWHGLIDEPEIASVARDSNWVKLSFQNQQANQTLLAFATLPSIPTLASPGNNATGQPTALTLSWNSVAGALTYEVRVATAAGFGVATVSDQAGLTGVSATVAGLAGSTTYYWQVNATNGAGTTAWSVVWSFTTTIGSPALSSPANGATGQPLTLSLSWGSVSGAVSYGVQVSTDMSFGSTVSGQSGLTGLYDVVSGLTGGVTYYWEANATGAAATGAWSGAWSFSAGMTQVIPLNTAWNMKSLNVIPLQDTTPAVFGTDPGGFLFVKDNAGDVYCPAAYQDNINYVQVGQGYQVYTTVPDTMEVLGIPVNYAATAIALSSGWNTIAYLPPSDDSIEHALAGIDTLLIIVKNNSGHAYWPSLGIDDIGIMYVGEGYKVLMSSAASLTYPTPDTGVAKRVAARGGKTMLRLPEPRHYATHANTGNNATLLAKRVTIGDKAVPDSSEIGAFDGTGSLVGSGTVMHGIAAFAVWGVDPQSKTKKKDGCAVSEPVTFRLWDGKREYPLDYVTQNGTPAKYGVDKVFLGVLSVPEGYLITKFDLTRAYPNPFRGSVKIAFDVPTIGGVTEHGIELAVYDLKGSLVKQLASGLYRAGHYALSWNSGEGRESGVGSSVYIVRMKAANFDKRLKLVRIQ